MLTIAAASGALDPLGRLVVQIIPLPPPGESSFLVNATRFVISHWFVVCLWLMFLGSVATVLYVAFDRALTKLERLAWALGFIFGQSVTVILYCVLQFLSPRVGRSPSVA